MKELSIIIQDLKTEVETNKKSQRETILEIENLGKKSEAYRTPNRLDQNRDTSSHIIIKAPNVLNKERIFRTVREKWQVTYKGRPIRSTPDFSPETMKARRSWAELMQRTQMPAQTTIPSGTLNYYRWRNQDIP